MNQNTHVRQIYWTKICLFYTSFKKVVWCYSEWQDAYDQLFGKVDFVESFPNMHKFYPKYVSLTVLDDMMISVPCFVSDLFKIHIFHIVLTGWPSTVCSDQVISFMYAM